MIPIKYDTGTFGPISSWIMTCHQPSRLHVSMLCFITKNSAAQNKNDICRETAFASQCERDPVHMAQ